MSDLLLARPRPGKVLRRPSCVALWAASRYSGSGDWLDLSGHSHPMAFGAGPAAPTFLNHAGVQYAYLPGLALNYLSIPSAASNQITGAIRVEGKIGPTDWTPAAQGTVVAKWTTTGNQASYMLRHTTGGFLQFTLSSNGTAAASATSSVVHGFTDGADKWVAAEWRPSDGRVQFFVSDDDVAWSQLGTDQTIAIASIHPGTSPVYFGQRPDGSADAIVGRYYRGRIYNNGVLACDVDVDKAVNTATTFAEQSPNAAVVTITRAATGKKLALVDRKMMLIGTDDFFETADHADLNFALTDSFTVSVLFRHHGLSAASNERLISKRSAITTGYDMRVTSSSVGGLVVSDLTNTPANATGWGSSLNGQITAMIGVRSVTADTLTTYAGPVQVDSDTDTTTGTSSNTLPLRIGAAAAAVPIEFAGCEIFAATVIREALSHGEVTRLARELVAA